MGLRVAWAHAPRADIIDSVLTSCPPRSCAGGTCPGIWSGSIRRGTNWRTSSPRCPWDSHFAHQQHRPAARRNAAQHEGSTMADKIDSFADNEFIEPQLRAAAARALSRISPTQQRILSHMARDRRAYIRAINGSHRPKQSITLYLRACPQTPQLPGLVFDPTGTTSVVAGAAGGRARHPRAVAHPQERRGDGCGASGDRWWTQDRVWMAPTDPGIDQNVRGTGGRFVDTL